MAKKKYKDISNKNIGVGPLRRTCDMLIFDQELFIGFASIFPAKKRNIENME